MSSVKTIFSVFSTLVLFVMMAISGPCLAAKPVQVFILAGQSNMEGKARVSLLERQIESPPTKQLFQHFRKDDAWLEREDVWIKFLDRKGKLTIGYGSPNCIGPELEFGHTVGNALDDQILIIKTAWGGKSLYRDFRSPSSGMPDEEELQRLLERAQKRKPETTLEDVKQSFGHFYRLMLEDVKNTLSNLQDHFPEYKDQGYELAGFVWFQGWNDMINTDYTAAYKDNMVNFIRDVRKDLDSPRLPFVIGQLGVGGTHEERPNAKKDAFKQAQSAAGDLPEFKGNVAVVKTDQYWDMEADAVFKKGRKENLEAWKTVGSDRPYHYLGSVKGYSRIGYGLAEASLKLMDRDVPASAINDEWRKAFAAPPSAKKTTPTFYDPLAEELEGWTLAVDPKLRAAENESVAKRAFEALANHLQRIKYILPKEKVAELQKLPIWIELHNEDLGAMQYHPNRGWLLAHDHDPRLVKHVHIPRAKALLDPGQWAKHPYVVMHELAHSYHDQVLSFDNPEIISIFKQAEEKGIYDEVLLYTGRKVRHYALSNHKEYFAESTESYLGVNDFYPFVRAELKKHDPAIFEVMKKVWGPIR